MNYSLSNEDAALFVSDLLMDLDYALQSITITKLDISGDYSVRIATGISLEDTVKDWVQKHYGLRQIT